MRGSWLRCKISALISGRYRKVDSCILVGQFQYRFQTSQSQVSAFPISACRFTDVYTLDSEKNGDINGRFSLRELCYEELRNCAWTRGSASSVSAPQIDPRWQCGRVGFRAKITTGTQEQIRLQEFDESPKGPKNWETDEESLRAVGRGESQKCRKGGEGPQKIAGRNKPSPLCENKRSSEVEGGLGCGSEEDWGNVPKKVVSENVVVKMCKAVRASGDGELSACGEANVRLLLALGSTEKQLVVVFKKNSKLHKERVAPNLLKFARLFHDFDMNGRDLLEGIAKYKGSGQSALLRSSTDKLKLILTFLRDEIGVKDLGKVVTTQPTLLSRSILAVQDIVSTLESLGVVVDSAFVEKFSSVLLINSESLRKRAHALDLALDPGIYIKQPMLLNVSRENVPKRVSNLKAVVGEALSVRELLVKIPSILIAGEETVRETWCKLVEMFGKEEVVRRVRRAPHILTRNWNTLHPKLEYLIRKGFCTGDILTYLPSVAIVSLDDTIKPRVEIALQSDRLQAGSVSLSTLLCNESRFNKLFGIKVLP